MQCFRNLRPRVGITAGVLLLAMFPANVGTVGEQSGRRRGRVFEARTQTPFPGGNIEISSDALVGGSRSTLSDSDGRFDFIELPPGKYRLKSSYEGLRPVQRQVSIGLGQSQELEVPVSAELSAEQTLVIVEERHHLDADRLSPGALLSAEQQDPSTQEAGFENRNTPSFATVTSRQLPFRAQLAVRYQY